ncbi:hypothetical protein XELAEV_18003630mg [Xenopus laevis]|nr:hypothetical protein XELAEV_18003630mg [Xenopus laevis]
MSFEAYLQIWRGMNSVPASFLIIKTKSSPARDFTLPWQDHTRLLYLNFVEMPILNSDIFNNVVDSSYYFSSVTRVHSMSKAGHRCKEF